MVFQNPIQRDIWQLQQQIFQCEECQYEFPDEYLGPDSIYVGDQFGMVSKIPKILFIGISPNSLKNEVGTRDTNIQIYGNNYENSINSADYYRDFFNGKNLRRNNQQFHYGGFSETNIYSKEAWSIKKVLTYLFAIQGIETNFAMTNAIQCKGTLKRGNPTASMRNKCLRKKWLRQTMDILKPDIIFIFSVGETNDSVWDFFTVANHLVDVEENQNGTNVSTNPINFWSYRPIINTPTGQIQPLTIAIPHFAISNFSSRVFVDILDYLAPKGEQRWNDFLNIIKNLIRTNTSFGDILQT